MSPRYLNSWPFEVHPGSRRFECSERSSGCGEKRLPYVKNTCSFCTFTIKNDASLGKTYTDLLEAYDATTDEIFWFCREDQNFRK